MILCNRLKTNLFYLYINKFIYIFWQFIAESTSPYKC